MATLTHIDNGKAGSITASDSVFGANWNPELVKEVILSIQSNRRANTAKTKDRAEVRGADTKPWRQKGTGRARHGSRYSPIWKGGGITFGPLNTRNYTKKVNRKARNTALRSALSYLVQNDNLSVASGLELKEPKTKTAAKFVADNLEALKKQDLQHKTGYVLTVVADNPSPNLKKSFRNLPGINIVSSADLNVEDVMRPRHLVVFDQNSLKAIETRLDK
jgi:large subunit ribosomal protein L4